MFLNDSRHLLAVRECLNNVGIKDDSGAIELQVSTSAEESDRRIMHDGSGRSHCVIICKEYAYL